MKIVCFGDSLTSCGGTNGRYSDILQDRFPGHVFVNRGVGGESFVEARERLETDVLAERPGVVITEFGANDWWRDERSYSAWAADLEDFILRMKATGARPVVLGVFGPYKTPEGKLAEKTYGIDDRARAYRELEAQTARKHDCPYIPNIQQTNIGKRHCWRDSNHPNEYGNRYVADMIEPVLAKLLQTPAKPVRKPNLYTTLDFWREAAALAPGKLAVVDGNRRLTYAKANELVERIAAGLHTITGATRPKVAVYLPNCLEYYLTYWAVQQLGGVIVPLNTWLKTESLAGVFSVVQPEVLVVRGPHDTAALQAARSSPETKIVMLDGAAADGHTFAGLLESKQTAPEVDVCGGDLSIIMHTSGTTAAPKGAMMRHSDLMFNAAAAINAHNFDATDVHLLVNPMFHCTALYSSLPTAAYQKTPVVIVSDTDPELLARTVERERITTFLSVPSVFQKMLALRNLDSFDWSSLRVMAYAGSPMPVAAVRELRQRFPDAALHNFFGLTETISMTHVLRNENVEDRPDSIGRLLPFVEAIVVDEHDRRLQPGEVGELLFAREEIIPGYYKQPERLQESIAELDGRLWFRTGDLASVDDEGFFYIKGRKKDMIIVGGENVFAAEVEAVLMELHGVKEAAVKGVPASGVRSHLGELVKAYVVPQNSSLTAQDIRKHCYERLPSYKVPAFIEFIDELPRNPAGKVVKDELG